MLLFILSTQFFFVSVRARGSGHVLNGERYVHSPLPLLFAALTIQILQHSENTANRPRRHAGQVNLTNGTEKLTEKKEVLSRLSQLKGFPDFCLLTALET